MTHIQRNLNTQTVRMCFECQGTLSAHWFRDPIDKASFRCTECYRRAIPAPPVPLDVLTQSRAHEIFYIEPEEKIEKITAAIFSSLEPH